VVRAIRWNVGSGSGAPTAREQMLPDPRAHEVEIGGRVERRRERRAALEVEGRVREVGEVALDRALAQEELLHGARAPRLASERQPQRRGASRQLLAPRMRRPGTRAL